MPMNSTLVYETLLQIKDSIPAICFAEVGKWGKYDKINAYDLFWANEYLWLYKDLLEYSLNYFTNETLVQNATFTESDIKYIINKVNEIIFKHGNLLF